MIAAFAPGIFSLDGTGSGQGAVEIAPGPEVAGGMGSYLWASMNYGGQPVQRGQYISIFSTGLGPVSNQPATGAPASASPLSVTSTQPTVTLGGVPAQVTFSGLAPGFVGLYVVNAQVPSSAPSGAAVTLNMTIGGVTSNTVTIAVQ